MSVLYRRIKCQKSSWWLRNKVQFSQSRKSILSGTSALQVCLSAFFLKVQKGLFLLIFNTFSVSLIDCLLTVDFLLSRILPSWL